MKPYIQTENSFRYYSYVLTYANDILVMHHDAITPLDHINHFFNMKPESMEDPDIYLEDKIRKCTMNNGVKCWSILSSKYKQEAVLNVKAQWQKTYPGQKWLQQAATIFIKDYLPGLDKSEELNPVEANYYQSLIGIVRWMIKIGRIDMITEVSLLYSYLANPRRGHLEAVFNIFAFLENNHNARMVFDPTYTEIDMRNFKTYDWKELYGYGSATEALQPDAPITLGNQVDLCLYVDLDQAGDKSTRRSRTGYFIFLNINPIIWFYKRQLTVETSVFGAEFVAM